MNTDIQWFAILGEFAQWPDKSSDTVFSHSGPRAGAARAYPTKNHSVTRQSFTTFHFTLESWMGFAQGIFSALQFEMHFEGILNVPFR